MRNDGIYLPALRLLLTGTVNPELTLMDVAGLSRVPYTNPRGLALARGTRSGE